MKVQGPYTRKDGRQHVVLYKDGVRKTVSYPKYLLEQKLGRSLLPNETCDHIDNDHTNNSLDNLQVLTRSDNARKGIALRPAEVGTFTCPVCNTSFTRRMSDVRGNLKKNKSGPYCSRSCAGKGGHPFNNIRSPSEKEHLRKALRRAEIGHFTCPVCNCSFTRQMIKVRRNLKHGHSGPYCSRSCAGKGGRSSNKGA